MDLRFLFQFQYGAIEGEPPPTMPPVANYFNSSMVRLKVPARPRNKKIVPTFQFQYGAIEGQ